MPKMDTQEIDRFDAVATYVVQIHSANASRSHSCEHNTNCMVNEWLGGVIHMTQEPTSVPRRKNARFHFHELGFDKVLTESFNLL